MQTGRRERQCRCRAAWRPGRLCRCRPPAVRRRIAPPPSRAPGSSDAPAPQTIASPSGLRAAASASRCIGVAWPLARSSAPRDRRNAAPAASSARCQARRVPNQPLQAPHATDTVNTSGGRGCRRPSCHRIHEPAAGNGAAAKRQPSANAAVWKSWHLFHLQISPARGMGSRPARTTWASRTPDPILKSAKVQPARRCRRRRGRQAQPNPATPPFSTDPGACGRRGDRHGRGAESLPFAGSPDRRVQRQ